MLHKCVISFSLQCVKKALVCTFVLQYLFKHIILENLKNVSVENRIYKTSDCIFVRKKRNGRFRFLSYSFCVSIFNI